MHGEQLGPQLPDFMSLQYNTIATYELQRVALTKEVAAQEDRIAGLEQEREQLNLWYIPALEQLRAERAERAKRNALDDAEKKKQREQRIQEHIANHVRDAQYRLDRANVRVNELQKKYTANAAYIDALQQEMGEACLLVGMNTPQEVYDEVNGPESPVPAPAAPAKPKTTEWAPHTGFTKAGQSTVKQSSVTMQQETEVNPWDQPKSKEYGDPEEGSSAQQATYKMTVDEYIAHLMSSQMNFPGQNDESQEAGPSTQRPRSHLYGNQEDAYGSSQQSNQFYADDDFGNVGPSDNGEGMWSPSHQAPPRQLRRSRRDVSDSSFRGPAQSPEGKSKDKGKGKEVARDATSGATTSSWDTDMF